VRFAQRTRYTPSSGESLFGLITSLADTWDHHIFVRHRTSCATTRNVGRKIIGDSSRNFTQMLHR
jgi:hypothetical protein